MWVPGEVPFAISVLNVQPDEVIGDVMQVQSFVHSPHVLLVVVVPAALVVPECGQSGESLCAWNEERRRSKFQPV